MANETILLDPITHRRGKVTQLVKRTKAGNEWIKIRAGWNLEVPNYWDIQILGVECTTDATVGNRYIKCRLYLDGTEYINGYQNAATAASSAGDMLLHRAQYLADVVPTTYADRLVYHDKCLMFGGDDILKIELAGGVVGDSFTLMALFIWRNWDLGLDLPEQFQQYKWLTDIGKGTRYPE